MSAEAANSRVTASIGDGYKVVSEARGHVTVSDEPAEHGGTDEAMSPTELLLSALTNCKLATMQMVAKRKGWDIKGTILELELIRNAADKEKTVMHQTIRFPEHLTGEQRERLTAVSHKCPVTKIVTGEVQILDIQ